MNPMVTFNSTTVPKEGTTFIFGSWICVADGQGGFHSHLANPVGPEANSSTSSDDAAKLASNLSKIQLFDLLRRQPSDHDITLSDQKEIQSETFSDLEKVADDLLITDATTPWEALIYDEYPDNEPIFIIGQYLDLTIASMSQGRFIYWKGIEPSELLGQSARLVTYIPDLP